jgi:hypothetical protein
VWQSLLSGSAGALLVTSSSRFPEKPCYEGVP